MEKCVTLMRELIANNDAADFLHPFDWKGKKLFDYPRKIKIEKDLYSIMAKLDAEGYDNPSEFAHDVRIVWRNHLVYFQKGSKEYESALALRDHFEKSFKGLAKDLSKFNNKGIPNGDEKLLFIHRCNFISSNDIGKIIGMVEKKCPAAKSKGSNDVRVDIQLESAESKHFWMLDDYVKQNLPPEVNPAKASNKKRKSRGESVRRPVKEDKEREKENKKENEREKAEKEKEGGENEKDGGENEKEENDKELEENDKEMIENEKEKEDDDKEMVERESERVSEKRGPPEMDADDQPPLKKQKQE